MVAFRAFGLIVPKYYYRKSGQEESNLLNLRRLRSSRQGILIGWKDAHNQKHLIPCDRECFYITVIIWSGSTFTITLHCLYPPPPRKIQLKSFFAFQYIIVTAACSRYMTVKIQEGNEVAESPNCNTLRYGYIQKCFQNSDVITSVTIEFPVSVLSAPFFYDCGSKPHQRRVELRRRQWSCFQGGENPVFGKPWFCLRDTRHFRHFRRFLGSEERNPLFLWVDLVECKSSFSPFFVKTTCFR